MPRKVLRIGIAGVLLSGAAISTPALATDPGATHREIRRLDLDFLQFQAVADFEGQEAIVRRMAELDPEHPQAYFRIERLCRARGERSEALPLMESLGSDGAGLVFGHALLRLQYDRKPREALVGFREALEEYRERDHRPGQAAAHLWLSFALDRIRDTPQAVEEVDHSIEVYREIEDAIGVAWNLRWRATLEAKLDRIDAAFTSAKEARRIFREARFPSGESAALHTAGTIASQAGRLEQAREALLRAVEIRRATNDRTPLVTSLSEYAQVLERMDRGDEALTALEEVVRLCSELGMTQTRAVHDRKMGDLLAALGRTGEAEQAYLRGIDAEGGPIGSTTMLQNTFTLGLFYRDAGEYRRATEVFESARERATPPRLSAWRARAELELGSIATLLGDQVRALELLEDGLADLHPRDVSRRQAALHNLARIYYNLGLYESAADFLEESLELAAGLDAPDRARARAWSGIGVVRDAAGDLDGALDAHRRSLEIREAIGSTEGVAWSRLNAAHSLWRAGRRDEARARLEQAMEGFRDSRTAEGRALALNIRGEFERDSGDRSGAASSFRSAAEVARRHGLEQQSWLAYYGLGRTHEASGKLGKALNEYRRAIDIVESLRGGMVTDEFKLRFFATTVELYDRAVTVQASLEGGPAPEAFALAERARARSLADLLVDARAGLRKGLSGTTAARERKLTDDVTAAMVRLHAAEGRRERKAARRHLRQAEQSLERFELTIRRESPAYSEIAYPASIDLSALQSSVLREGEVLLRYFMGEHEALLWVVTRSSASLHRLGPPERIRLATARFRESEARATPLFAGRQSNDVAADLAEILLPDPLPDADHWLIVPDGPLHFLPFEALRRDGTLLIERGTVALVPSATTLDLLRSDGHRTPSGGLAAIGNPVIPASLELPPISDIFDELAATFTDPAPAVLRGAEATRERVLALDLTPFRYVHFATHGLLGAEDPTAYGLLLSPSEGQETPGILHTADVPALKLDSELVVLAACRSGIGETLRGEGLVGMGRAFLFAGTRSLLVSLWNVDDRATADFMRAFYERLAAGQPVAEALRQTKLSFLRSDRSARRRTYQWAPFVLVGDPSAQPGGAAIAVNPGAARPTSNDEGRNERDEGR